MTDPQRPGPSAYLRTGKGQVVRVPHFIDQCDNCKEPARFWFVRRERQKRHLAFACDGPTGCGIKGRVVVDMLLGRDLVP